MSGSYETVELLDAKTLVQVKLSETVELLDAKTLVQDLPTVTMNPITSATQTSCTSRLNFLKLHQLKWMPNKTTNLLASFADQRRTIKLNKVIIVFDYSVFISFLHSKRPHTNNNTFLDLINETMGYVASHGAVHHIFLRKNQPTSVIIVGMMQHVIRINQH
ncbi:hypothetical protein OROMI_031165 [Orobanche minor]